jgi:hypothetical protein
MATSTVMVFLKIPQRCDGVPERSPAPLPWPVQWLLVHESGGEHGFHGHLKLADEPGHELRREEGLF